MKFHSEPHLYAYLALGLTALAKSTSARPKLAELDLCKRLRLKEWLSLATKPSRTWKVVESITWCCLARGNKAKGIKGQKLFFGVRWGHILLYTTFHSHAVITIAWNYFPVLARDMVPGDSVTQAALLGSRWSRLPLPWPSKIWWISGRLGDWRRPTAHEATALPQQQKRKTANRFKCQGTNQ